MNVRLTLTISKAIPLDTSPMDEVSEFYGLTPIDRAGNPIRQSFEADGWEVVDWTHKLERDRSN